MEARLTALESRLRQTKRALFVERLARQTAEAGVDAEEIGRLPMFSGDIDLNALVPVESHCPRLLRKFPSDGSLDAAASGNALGRSDHH